MFQGTVTFQARIKGNGLRFPLVEFNPGNPGVEKVEIEGPNGDDIRTTVYLASVTSPSAGRALATEVHKATLDRIAFNRDLVIENGRITGSQFSPLNPQPGVLSVDTGEYLLTGSEVRFVLSCSAVHLKTELMQALPPGQQYYGLFRSARQSLSPVEEFMHLYHILLMLNNDSQADVDAFIKSQEPGVVQTPQPPIPGQRKRRPGPIMETVYTKLRNEFSHKRAHVDLERTKSEMEKQLPGLIKLTKQVIEQHP
jgi:hypothetical protein